MDYLVQGWSVEEMCRQHLDLSLAEAHAAMAYYFDHQEEIDREIAAEIEQVESEAGNLLVRRSGSRVGQAVQPDSAGPSGWTA